MSFIQILFLLALPYELNMKKSSSSSSQNFTLSFNLIYVRSINSNE